jgi:hypothetical protein
VNVRTSIPRLVAKDLDDKIQLQCQEGVIWLLQNVKIVQDKHMHNVFEGRYGWVQKVKIEEVALISKRLEFVGKTTKGG